MIAGIFHQGSGLGNQLHRYVMTRVLALDKGYDFGMIYKPDGSGKEEGFKGKSFMKIDIGKPVQGVARQFIEKKVVENGIDIRSYDPEINFVEDNTIIDGEFQDERYFGHRLNEIREWLKVEPLYLRPDLCVIGFRGGEYVAFPDLFLTKDYWLEAIKLMQITNLNMKFEVHTDDPETAQKFFPDFKCIHDIGLNWRSILYARQLIIANSSFYILPALLNKNCWNVIAPRYWARRNIKVWALPQNYYKKFMYI